MNLNFLISKSLFLAFAFLVANTSFAQMSVTITSGNVSCNGGNNGFATASILGGVGASFYLWSDNSQTTASITGLGPGLYTVTATDVLGTSVVDSVLITEPSILGNIVFSVINATCLGSADGQLTANLSGGTQPYTYLWGAAASNQYTVTATGLATGTFFLTVTDDNGCTITDSAFVSEPSTMLSGVIINQVDATCNGVADGSIEVNAQGGTPNYSYQWSNGQTSSLASGIYGGTHTVTITDANACSISVGGVVGQPSPIILNPQLLSNYNGSAITCPGAVDGSVGVTAAGGPTMSYSYNWGPLGQNTPVINGLLAGTYCVTVYDGVGCQADTCIVVNDPIPLAATYTKTNIHCNGATSGQIVVTATSGTGSPGVNGYEYKIAGPGQSSVYDTINVFNGLDTGVYDIFVMDANGCAIQFSVGISEQVPLILDSIALVDNVCGGIATAYGSGGTGSISYHWSHDIILTTQTATHLAAGAYTVTIADGDGCTVDTSFTMTQATNLISGYLTTADALCYGSSTAELGAVVQGGTSTSGTYSYLWNTTPVQATVVADSLPAGIYTVTITDDTACRLILTGTVGEASELLVTASVQQHVGCFGGSGGIAIANTVTGGTPPYSYIWTDPNSQSTQVATNLAVGPVSVVVTDNNVCTATSSVTITEAPQITVTPIINNVSCNGGTDGSITISSPNVLVSYLWDVGIGNPLSGLAPGTYGLTVTDNFGCTGSFSFGVTEPDNLMAAVIDNNNGTATVFPTGGTPPYFYQWGTIANNQTTATAIGLSDSTSYSVTVTDNNGCEAVGIVSIRVGIEQISSLERFDLYPNPSYGVFNLDVLFRKEEEGMLEIRDVLGRLVFSKKFKEDEVHEQIKLDKASAGMYFLSLKVGGQVITKKVQVEF